MRIATIDIGTNTILMLIAEIEPNGQINILGDYHYIARIGEGVDQHCVIQEKAFERAYNVFLELKKIAESSKVDKIIAFGTSALRSAKNRDVFLNFIKKELSIEVKVISNEEEAKLTYLGAAFDYLQSNLIYDILAIDIGGGSTEIIYGKGRKIEAFKSVEIGSVRLTERILNKYPPKQEQIEKAIDLIKEHIKDIPKISSITKAMGVAGTLTTLAAVDLKMETFEPKLVHGHLLTYSNIQAIFQELKLLTYEQLKKHPYIHPMRADIILAGTLILIEIMNKLNLETITVSTYGLRYGMLAEFVWTLNKNP